MNGDDVILEGTNGKIEPRMKLLEVVSMELSEVIFEAEKVEQAAGLESMDREKERRGDEGGESLTVLLEDREEDYAVLNVGSVGGECLEHDAVVQVVRGVHVGQVISVLQIVQE